MYLEHPGVGLLEVLELAEEAERRGFDLVAAGDGYAENFALVGALAARTSTVELFSAVVTPSRSPVTTALGAATVAELAPGRYRLGLGALARRWSESWHDLDGARPVERMRDFAAAVRAAWQGAPGRPATHSGPFYRIPSYERPTPPPEEEIPLYLAANRPRMIELAGEIADGAIFAFLHPADWLRTRGRELLGRAGRTVDVGLVLFCAVGDSTAAARDLLRPGLEFHMPNARDVFAGHGFEHVSDRMIDTLCLAGTPEEARAQLRRYDGAVDWVCLMPPMGLAPEVSREQVLWIMETFGR
jgi:alkanesulfonate monooxygenase SsuD/methylene tetrahydromethanopterin reductase-like flavin-dependent oxidoreductase (luciferase family)